MSTGKIGGSLLAGAVLSRLGAADPDVLVGPGAGLDVGVVRVGPGTVAAITTDPFFVLPALGWRRAGWFAVHVLASDAATSGLPPRFLTVDLNLPPELADDELAELWAACSEAAAEIGVSVVAGHTARYDGCAWPMAGGATCFALGPEDRYVTPAMARPGERVVLTKGAAIEATALLAASFPHRTAAAVGAAYAAAATDLVDRMSVVADCAVAAAYGLREDGVTAMHDATEGGVLGGLAELAAASRVGLRVDLAAVPVRAEVAAVCAAAGMDPYAAISEGTLLATVRPGHVDGLLAAWRSTGVEAAEVGEVVPAAGGCELTDGRPLRHPGADPYWAAYARWSAAAGALHSPGCDAPGL